MNTKEKQIETKELKLIHQEEMWYYRSEIYLAHGKGYAAYFFDKNLNTWEKLGLYDDQSTAKQASFEREMRMTVSVQLERGAIALLTEAIDLYCAKDRDVDRNKKDRLLQVWEQLGRAALL